MHFGIDVLLNFPLALSCQTSTVTGHVIYKAMRQSVKMLNSLNNYCFLIWLQIHTLPATSNKIHVFHQHSDYGFQLLLIQPAKN